MREVRGDSEMPSEERKVQHLEEIQMVQKRAFQTVDICIETAKPWKVRHFRTEEKQS